MTEKRFTSTARPRRSPVTLGPSSCVADLTAIAFSLCAASYGLGAQPASDPPSQASSTTAQSTLDTVTIKARGKELERQVSHFVFSVPIHYLNDPLSRWDVPICPLVAGLTRDQGEFILAHLSQIAIDAKAPMSGAHCKPNFYVVVTSEPDLLLEKWHKRDRHMFSTRNGMGYINSFLHTARPIRVWYNIDFTSLDKTPIFVGSPALLGSGIETTLDQIPTNTVPDSSPLRRTALLTLSTVIEVVDANRTKDFNLGQLADYIAMVGLAEVNLDANVTVPTILSLFRNTENPPHGLSGFDQAFLDSLYDVDQANVLQAPMMKASMVKRIAP